MEANLCMQIWFAVPFVSTHTMVDTDHPSALQEEEKLSSGECKIGQKLYDMVLYNGYSCVFGCVDV